MKRQMRNGWLILALGILSLSTSSLHTAAQVRPPIAPPPTTKEEPRLPDLVPKSINWFGEPFCAIGYTNLYINLRVFVENIGVAAAPASTVAVTFGVHDAGGHRRSWVTYSKPVPSLLAGSLPERRARVDFEVPERCFNPNPDPDVAKACEFTITVDSSRQVEESREDNNTARAKCQPL